MSRHTHGLHVLYIHQNFPAQFGHLGAALALRCGWKITFVSSKPATGLGVIRRLQYRVRGSASSKTHFAAAGFENYTWHSHAIFETLKAHPEIRPDVIVSHSGFGTTLFLKELYDAPIVHFCEWFYRTTGGDTDFLPEKKKDVTAEDAEHAEKKEKKERKEQQGTHGMSNDHNSLRSRGRNAMLLADLENCTLGYCPTNWQRSQLPHEYQHKLETIFDGIDTDLWRPPQARSRHDRQVAGHKIPDGVKVVTYVSRGFESTRGFDVFMEVARGIYQRDPNVVFVCIGTDRVCYGGDLAQIKEKSFREHVLKRGRYDLSRFLFTGPVPPQELAKAFGYSDLHIYLTAPFVLSWSLMDALACGCTVLASDTPPLLEVVEHGRNGLLAPFWDVDRFVDLACAVLADPEAYRQSLGKNGLETIHARYSLEQVLPRMIALYERAIAGDVPARCETIAESTGRSMNACRLANGHTAPAWRTRWGFANSAPAIPLSEPGSYFGPSPNSLRPRGSVTRPGILQWLGRIGKNWNGSARKAAINSRPWPASPPVKPPRPQWIDSLRLPARELEWLEESIPADSRLILEIGAWRGDLSMWLATRFPRATILCVDAWAGSHFPQPDHPHWKILLPDVWESFVANCWSLRARIVPIADRHDLAIAKLRDAGLEPDAIIVHPDYDTAAVKSVLSALGRHFSHIPWIGFIWSWDRLQQALTKLARESGRALTVRGSMWRLEPAKKMENHKGHKEHEVSARHDVAYR